MRTRIFSLALIALAACGSSDGASSSPGGNGFSVGAVGGTFGGTVSTSAMTNGGTSGGFVGSDSLDGDLAFPLANVFGSGLQGAAITVDFTDGAAGCADSDATNVVRVVVTSEDGGPPSYGTYQIPGNAQVLVFNGSTVDGGPAYVAASGFATLDLFESDTVGGNFDAHFDTGVDGGSELSGTFSVNLCF